MTLQKNSYSDVCTDDITESGRSNAPFRQKYTNTKPSSNTHGGRIKSSKISEEIKASSIIKFPLGGSSVPRSFLHIHLCVRPLKVPPGNRSTVLGWLTQTCPVSSSHCPSARGLNPNCNVPNERAESVCGRKRLLECVCVCVCLSSWILPHGFCTTEVRLGYNITVFMAIIYSDHTKNLWHYRSVIYSHAWHPWTV